MFPKLSPPEDAQTKVDCCGIQSINVAVNLHFEIVTVTTMASFINKGIGEFLEDFTTSVLICLPQIPSGDRLAKSKVVVFGFVSLQTQHQITHAIPGNQLTKHHAKHLVPKGEGPYIFVAIVDFYKPVENPAGQKICKLSENVLALIHGILFFTKLKTKLSIQIVTLQKSTTNAMYKEFQRTNLFF